MKDQEHECVSKALNSEAFEADDAFLVKLSINLGNDQKRLDLYGKLETPASIVNVLSVPLFFSSDIHGYLSGVDRNIRTENSSSLKDLGIAPVDVYNLFKKLIGTDSGDLHLDKFERHSPVITLVQIISEDDEDLITKSFCSEGKECHSPQISRACNFAKRLAVVSHMKMHLDFKPVI